MSKAVLLTVLRRLRRRIFSWYSVFVLVFISVPGAAIADTWLPSWRGIAGEPLAKQAGCIVAEHEIGWSKLWRRFGLDQPFDLPDSLMGVAIYAPATQDCSLTVSAWLAEVRAHDGAFIKYRIRSGEYGNQYGGGTSVQVGSSCEMMVPHTPIHIFLIDRRDPWSHIKYADGRWLFRDAETTDSFKDAQRCSNADEAAQ
jgi:hypothetical protein